jgi:hypothetical protein
MSGFRYSPSVAVSIHIQSLLFVPSKYGDVYPRRRYPMQEPEWFSAGSRA